MSKDKEKNTGVTKAYTTVEMPKNFNLQELSNPENSAMSESLFAAAMGAKAVDVTADYVDIAELQKSYIDFGSDITGGVPIIYSGTKKIKSINPSDEEGAMVEAVVFFYQKLVDGAWQTSRGINANTVLVSNMLGATEGEVYRIKPLGKKQGANRYKYEDYQILKVQLG